MEYRYPEDKVVAGLIIAIIGFVTEAIIKALCFSNLGGNYQWILTLFGVFLIIILSVADMKDVIKNGWCFAAGFVIGSLLFI